jgi:hypothetical protein
VSVRCGETTVGFQSTGEAFGWLEHVTELLTRAL